MSNSRSIDVLFYSWLAFTLLLGTTVISQSVSGKYGPDWAIPLQWAFSAVAPCMTLLLAVWTNKGKAKWKNSAAGSANFWLAFILSVITWVGTIGMFVFEAVSRATIYDILPIAGIGFTFLQAIIIGCISSIAFSGR